ncbi:hypothetical protein ACHAWO_009926 [Cyclotella atomus]|uniref:DM2 domain-containing protein n=1 Tax=Cyclotella atomus TaxID=382360 RepID=A0ABD3Q3Q8_9STRA
MTSASAHAPSSSLPEIYQSHRLIIQRLDDLEHNLTSRVAAHRRRASNILDITTGRRTHMRVFVSHRLDDESNISVEQKPAAVAPPPKPLGGKDFGALLSAAAAHHVLPQKKSHRKWTLVIEGGLLVQQLDHASAKEVDRRRNFGLPILGSTHNEEKDRLSSKNQYPTEVQELNQSVKPLQFTHLFDKLEVELRAVKHAASVEGAAPSYEGSSTGHHTKTFTWSRAKSNTPDSHAFFIVYNEEGRVPLIDPNEKDKSESPKAVYDSEYISAHIKLYRRQGSEDMYVPSDQLCEVLFPSFTGKKAVITSSKKRKAQEIVEPFSDALKNVIIPNTLTMDEVLRAIFYYIRTRNLHDSTDLSIVNFDDALTQLFGTNRMVMAELRKTLLERGLLVKVEPETHPIIFNYKMAKDGAEPLVEKKVDMKDAQIAPSSTDANAETTTRTRSSYEAGKEKDEATEKHNQNDPHLQTMISCDVDIEIPNIYNLRARDIFRKINHREHEHTSCRNKAKNALVATKISEEIAKQAVDDAISGSNLRSDLKQVWMALANEASEGGEAHRSALIELRTASLMEKLEERTAAANRYWSIVETCKSIANDTAGSLA